MKLGIITSHFNPCQYKRCVRNYQRFVEGLGEHSADLLTAELVLDEDAELDCPRVRLRCRGTRPGHCLWQKERLLNAAWSSLPVEYDAVAWIDADVLFPAGSDWVAQTEKMLETKRLVQLFERSEMLGPDDVMTHDRTGIAARRIKPGAKTQGAWGLAWAARRDDVSLFDVLVAGGADVYMGKIFMGEHPRGTAHATQLAKAYREWAQQQKCRGLKDVGFLPLTIKHLFHGTRENRRYLYRDGILQRHRFDPARDIVSDGATYRWADAESHVARETREWFLARREDA